MIRLLALTAVITLGIALPADARSNGATTDEPTVTLERYCGLGWNTVDVILTGFPPFTSFELTLAFGDGAIIGPFTTDADGFFNSGTIGHIGSFEPITFTATIVWEGGTLTSEPLFVDCSKPASKPDCKDGRWRDFPDFKNQGECLAFVQHAVR